MLEETMVQTRSRRKSSPPQAIYTPTTSEASAQSHESSNLVDEFDEYSDVRSILESKVAADRAKFLESNHEENWEMPYFPAVTSYLGYAILIVVGHIRDAFANYFRFGRYYNQMKKKSHKSKGQTPERAVAVLLKSWENFYTRRIYHRVQDSFNRPIGSAPAAHMKVLERISTDGSKSFELFSSRNKLYSNDNVISQYTNGEHFGGLCCEKETTDDKFDSVVSRECLNLGSYNYLGFADDWSETCKENVLDTLSKWNVSASSSRMEFGTTALHTELEDLVARFVGKGAALVYNMGFATNSTTIPALVTSSADLIISDQLNHTSIVNGARASGAAIRTFRHNSSKHLEEILREAIVMGQPRTRRPWNRIWVIVEGVYSMEGEYCNLKEIVRVCKKYKAFVYLDEAHSIGAMGATGRGICEYTGVNPADVDVMMGTFTKSFGGMGGYIAADPEIIDYLRRKSAGSLYHNSLSPIVCQQILTSFRVIMGEDGTDIGRRKLQKLRDNSNYFRMKLEDMGLQVLGNYDSPIMPVMLYNPTKIPAFSRECLKRGLAVVVVGFPAVPLLMARARFCISAGHSRADLDRALNEIDEIAKINLLRYSLSSIG